MSWQTAVLFAFAGSFVVWAGSRYYYFISSAASRKPITSSEKLGILVLSLGLFPVWLGILIWPAPLNWAGGSVSRWLLVAGLLVAFYYGLFHFWAWRRTRLTAAGRYERVHYVLKPTSAVGWVVYIYAGLFLLWQLVHWLAPSIMPAWIR